MVYETYISYRFSGEKTDAPEKRCSCLSPQSDVCHLTGEVCEYVGLMTRFPRHTFESSKHYDSSLGCFFAQLQLKSRSHPLK